jgi:hypothetical protein
VGDQAAGDWVAVHVPDLLDPLAGAVDVEVVVAGVPEGSLSGLL